MAHPAGHECAIEPRNPVIEIRLQLRGERWNRREGDVCRLREDGTGRPAADCIVHGPLGNGPARAFLLPAHLPVADPFSAPSVLRRARKIEAHGRLHATLYGL